ncbi:hypothetical protein Aduo_005671 [Ancylostoma duodenale]
MISHVNYGPRLHCFTTSLQHRAVDQVIGHDSQNINSEQMYIQQREAQSWSSNTFSSGTNGFENDSDESDQIGREERESTKSSRSRIPREVRMLRPLHEQLGHVTKLAKLTSRSRMDVVSMLVDALSTFDAIEDVVKRTKEEIFGTLNSIENRIIAEDSNHTAHMTRVCETLQPVHQKYAALREVRASLIPLMEKVPGNDATTNRFRTNATSVKQITNQLNDLDQLRISRWERPPAEEGAVEMHVLVAELLTALSSLRESVEVMDSFLCRSEAWYRLKSTMDMQTSGIEKYFLDKCPAQPLSEYIRSKCPTSSRSSSFVTSGLHSPRSHSKGIRLEPWTSASALTTMRTSCVSSSEVLSAKMTSDIMQSYEQEAYDGEEVVVDRGEQP